MTPATFSGIAIAALIGLVLAWLFYRVARRGKAIDQTPHCATCGFNLTGRPPDSPRCSECGAEL